MTTATTTLKATKIGTDFIADFITTTATEDDARWIDYTRERCKEQAVRKICQENPGISGNEAMKKAGRVYFSAFRSEFIRRYFPELLTKTHSKRKDVIGDAIKQKLGQSAKSAK